MTATPSIDGDELEIRLPHLTLAARAWGPASGRPVLALHGWLDNAASFDALAPRLEGLRVVALDHAGHGRSDRRPPGVAYSYLDWVLDALGAADTLGWERFAVLGHSLGAAIANTLAGTWPDRIERIVLVDGFSPKVQEPDEAPARLAEFVARRDATRGRPDRVMDDREAAAERLTQTIRGLSIEGARVLAGRGTRPVEGGLGWARDPRVQLGPPLRLSREHMRAFLTRVRCPALFLRPRSGWPVDPAIVAAVRAAIRGSRYVELDGGHHVHLERPEAVAEVAGPFLLE